MFVEDGGVPVRTDGLRVLLSTVSSDSHTWNLVYLHLLLEENGHAVVNLGSCVPDALLAAAVGEHRPDVLVVSTVNGHGFLDGARAIRAVRATPSGRAIPAVIGGKLGILGQDNEQYEELLLTAGFDAVFAEAGPEVLTEYLDTIVRPLVGAAERPLR